MLYQAGRPLARMHWLSCVHRLAAAPVPFLLIFLAAQNLADSFESHPRIFTCKYGRRVVLFLRYWSHCPENNVKFTNILNIKTDFESINSSETAKY